MRSGSRARRTGPGTQWPRLSSEPPGWAAAWATDFDGRPLFPVTPGGERQREMAYRFGVNLAMYALTGNYKSDQAHTRTILQRLRRAAERR